MYRVVNREPDLSHLPAEIRPLVARCLAKDPAGRPSTDDLLTELGGGHLAANWLPAQIVSVLGRYSPPGQAVPAGAANASSWPETEDLAAGAPVVWTPTAPARKPARNGASRARRWSRGRPAWASAVAAIVVASAATAFTLGASGPQRAVAASSSLPAIPNSIRATAHAAPKGVVMAARPARSRPARSRPAERHSPKRAGASAVPQAAPPPSPATVATSPPPAPRPTHSSPPPPSSAIVPDVLGSTLSGASAAIKARGLDNIPYLYGCYGSPGIDDVVSQSPATGTSYGENQPVSLKLQANNC